MLLVSQNKLLLSLCRCSLVVKHVLGKNETVGPIPTNGSRILFSDKRPTFWWDALRASHALGSSVSFSTKLEPRVGIEPTFLLYESSVLPLNYIGLFFLINKRPSFALLLKALLLLPLPIFNPA